MKQLIILIVIVGISISANSQIIEKQINKISFRVSNVKPAENLLPEVDYKKAIEICLGAEIEGFQSSEKGKKIVPTNINAFIAALHNSFAQHRPMVISPDMIWLLICQGVAMHIEKNQDSLRNTFVEFKGKKEIKVRRDDFQKGAEENDWSKVFPIYTDSIRKYLKDSILQLFVPKFSTTGIIEKNAFEIAFMSSVYNYFEFGFETFCGIPEITLEGSFEDWKWIADNCKNLDKLGLKNWHENLQPILNEFVNASNGTIDTLFWQSIYKHCSCSGGERMTGWIIKFFPYIYNKEQLVKNYLISGKSYAYDGLTADKLPLGYSKIGMKWYYFNKIYKMVLYSGFVGISQDSATKALRPKIGWAVADSADIENERITRIQKFKQYEETADESILPKNLGIWTRSDRYNYRQLEIEHWYRFEKEAIKINEKEFDESNIGPNLFPEKCKNYKESLEELKNIIKITLGKRGKGFKGTFLFVVTWFGEIDKVKMLDSNKPKLNDEIISIINGISKCKPAISNGLSANSEIKLDLEFD